MLKITKPVPDLEFISNDGLMHHASWNPSKYLRSLTSRGAQSEAVQNISSEDFDHFESIKLMRKYYSKKVLHITCVKKDFTHYSKYRCKALKALSLIGPCRLQIPPFPLKSLIIPDNGSAPAFKGIKINKLTSACKHLETFIFEKTFNVSFLKGVRKMVNLKALTITVTEEHLLHMSQMFTNLRYLRTMNLKIKGTGTFKTEEKIERLLLFFKNMIGLETLKTLRLNFHDALLCKDEIFIETLLEYLGQSRLQSFNIQIKLQNCGPLDLKKINSLLSKVDFLAIRGSEKESFIDHINNFPGRQLTSQRRYLQETTRMISKSQKVLDILIHDIHSSQLLNIFSSFQKYNCLESLYVNIKEAGTQVDILQRFSWTQNLKNIILDLENLPDRNIRNAILGLVRLMKLAGNLETLTLCDSNDWIYTSNTKNEAIDILLEQLPNMKSLRSLKIENLTLNLISWETVKRMLTTVKNLRHFYFYLRAKQKPSPVEMYFPFDEVSQLTELRMQIPFSLVFAALEHFVVNISKLQSLEILDIQKESLAGITYDLVCTILENLTLLKNLREVSICTAINYDQINQFVPNFQGNAEEALIGALKSKVRDLLNSNTKLERVHLYQENWFDIKYTR